MTDRGSPERFADLPLPVLLRLADEYTRTPVHQGLMLGCSHELISRGRLEEARTLLVRAVQADHSCEECHALLGRILETTGSLAQAVVAWQNLLRLDPGNAGAWARLGAVHCDLAQWGEALDAFERARTLEPANPRNLFGLAMTLLALGRLQELTAVRDDLLARYPQLGLSHLVDGHVWKINSQREHAVSAYQRALDLDPTLTTALFNLTELSPPPLESELCLRIQELRDTGIGGRDRANVCFSLARIHDAGGNHAAAFSLYQEGNAAALDLMKTRGIVYDEIAVAEDAQMIMRDFTAGALGAPLDRLQLKLTLIFIIGLPRSGTTLVEQILASHPQVAAGGELPLMQDCLAAFNEHRKRQGRSGPVNSADPQQAALLRDMRTKYLDGLFERDLDKDFVTDKLPANFNAVGLIRLLFADAVIVHCVREPLAVCWSLYTTNFGMHEPYCNSFESLAHYHQIYSRLMVHWSKALRSPMVEVKYEELVVNPRRTIERLLAGCGLDWHEGCMNFHTLNRPVYTASQLQVRRPIYDSSVSRWKNYERFLIPLKDRLGQVGLESAQMVSERQ